LTSRSRSGARSQSGSFRDPGGRLVILDNRVFRFVNGAGAKNLHPWLQSELCQQLVEQHKMVRTEILRPEHWPQALADPSFARQFEAIEAVMIVEHERIWFPSFPTEWPPEMLHAAGRLTVEIALESLDAGFGLKDATPYNVLFDGPNAVFVDALSFERRDPADPVWLPYAQFVRTFLLPLLMNHHLGMHIDRLLAARPDGLEPEDVYHWLSLVQKLRPPFLSLVTIPKWLGGSRAAADGKIYQKRSTEDPAQARFVLRALLNGLGRKLEGVEPEAGRTSAWSGYMQADGNHYSDEQFARKEDFVRRALEDFGPRRVLDVGSNTGHFSLMSAGAGAHVVAIDSDPVVAGKLWRAARAQGADVLPLVVNLARPTPGSGWHNTERASFLDRCAGAFDAVLMLAVLHHLLVTDRIPLDHILDLTAELTTSLAVVEFIEPSDPMFQRLTRGREHLHTDVTTAAFEQSCHRHFEIMRSERLPYANRWLYLLKKPGR